MRKNNSNEPFETPPAQDVPAITSMHLEVLDSSNSDDVWQAAGMNNVILETVGRKSGRPRRVVLPYWLDEDDHRIVVASNTGQSSHPAWFHNLADKSANPTVFVQEKSERWRSDAEVLTGEDYEAVWAELTIDRPYYLDYAAGVTRQIPLVRLPKT